MPHFHGISGYGGRIALWNPLVLGEEDSAAAAAAAAPTQYEQKQGEADKIAEASAQRMKAISDGMKKEIKREMMKTAAAQTAITVSLNFIPIVGPVLSLASSAIFAVDQRKYKKLMEEESKKAEARIKQAEEKLANELIKRQEQILEEEIGNANDEILAELQGGGVEGLGFGFVKRITKDIKRSVSRVHKDIKRSASDVNKELKRTGERITKEIERIPENAQEQFDVIRGKAGYAALRDKLNELVAENLRRIEDTRKVELEKFETPGYRSEIRQKAKAMLLSDPDYVANLKTLQQTFPATSPAVQQRIADGIPSNNWGTVALVGGAAFAAFMLLR